GCPLAARLAARLDALPIWKIHGERCVANARRASRLQRRTSRAHPREDSCTGLLCATGNAYAGEDRVSHCAYHADARGAVRLGHRARAGGTHARDKRWRMHQRKPFVLAVAKAWLLRAAPGLGHFRREANRRARGARRRAVLARWRIDVLAQCRVVAES